MIAKTDKLINFYNGRNNGKRICIVHWCYVLLQVWKQVSPVFSDGKEGYQCPYCPTMLTRRYHLKRHLQTVHDVGDAPSFTCHCGYTTKRQDYANKHKRKCDGYGLWFKINSQ